MKITDLGLGIQGVSWVPNIDERGSLTRVFDSELLQNFPKLNQISLVRNSAVATLRGLHFQIYPKAESKIVSCLHGRLFDVMVQIEPESSDFGKIVYTELSAENGINSLIIPGGFAHGYLTLERNTEILYSMDVPHSKEHARGIHWSKNDLNIPWPTKVRKISQADEDNPSWDEYFNRERSL
jgi:dTDP-4-dehydrorhamnose 3,5-epimerase